MKKGRTIFLSLDKIEMERKIETTGVNCACEGNISTEIPANSDTANVDLHIVTLKK